MSDKRGKVIKKDGILPNQETNSPNDSPNEFEKKSIQNLIKDLAKKYNLQKEDFLSLFEGKPNSDLPISIFDNKKLSSLETISKYLREVRQLKFSQIASFLNRDPRTIWSAYNSSKKKHPSPLTIRESNIVIPLSKLSNKKFSILESIVAHLKETYSLTFHNIAVLLNRDDRTIWTVYSRFKKKGGEFQRKISNG